ncbi:serine protease 48 isoform X1 [Lepeophtheirus salmonis]|uniref:serine protease 48 isoform X1 n=1 Tax=Lepeophtheirus salmonis TaxID=72036 RepID=UPI001AE9904F|nr:serine protease 48-like [Lepeophtheirus salmonis]
MLIIQPYSWNMFYMVLFVFFPLDLVASDCVCGQGAAPDFMSSIADKPTGLTTVYPWLSLVTGPFNKNNPLGMCSGALVNQHYVAIDESCFDYSEIVKVQFPFENINVSGKVIKTKHDYTLIELESKINTTSLIQPACIPSPGSINLTENSEAIATYFNETGAIHRALMQIVPNDDSRCTKINFGRVLESDKICAIILNNATFCPESVGIPLTVHANGSWFLIGISYLHEECSSNVGAIFTNFKDTIDQTTKDIGGKCVPPTPLPVTSTTEGEIITSTTEGDINTSTPEGGHHDFYHRYNQ